ncbi:GNAT family N-acetyltransferase [Marinicrinis sediminis]|uniref:GNAT family N-acetyltransferase n=1 Tax=Marinicrinis sediminis TaxID=1652465 RepID=A0ABW5RF02_9BACL
MLCTYIGLADKDLIHPEPNEQKDCSNLTITNQAAGFTQLYPSFSSVSMRKTWVLNDLYVDPDHRGCGVAAQLIEHVKQFAHETRAVRVSLSTAINNETAQRLYERTGFQKDQQFFHYAYTL